MSCWNGSTDRFFQPLIVLNWSSLLSSLGRTQKKIKSFTLRRVRSLNYGISAARQTWYYRAEGLLERFFAEAQIVSGLRLSTSLPLPVPSCVYGNLSNYPRINPIWHEYMIWYSVIFEACTSLQIPSWSVHCHPPCGRLLWIMEFSTVFPSSLGPKIMLLGR